MKKQSTTEWLEYFPKKVYDEAMTNIKLQKMEHILSWKFISGIAAVSLAFDFTKSKEVLRNGRCNAKGKIKINTIKTKK